MKLFGKKRGEKNRLSSKMLALCMVLLLVAALSVGITIAYLQAQTNTVTNTFTAADITYTLHLEANAQSVSHQDSEVTMPAVLVPVTTTALSADFTPTADPAMTGYTFAGWYYDADLTKEYTDIADKTITVNYGDEFDSNTDANKVDITLYAKWTPITYTVKYDKNGPDAWTTGTTADSVHTYDVAQNLTKNGYVRTGYTFKGWAEASDGAVKYTDEQSVVNLANTQDAEVTLYAVWAANDVTYKVEHWLQNVDGADVQNETNYTLKETDTLSAKADSSVTPAVNTYTGFTSPSTQTVTVSPDGTTVVKYYYTRNSYEVILNMDTGIATVTGAGTYKYGASVTIDATLANGYEWENWDSEQNAYDTTTQKYTFEMPAMDVTSKAMAKPIVYKITYDHKGGALPSGKTNPATYTIESNTITLNNPDRHGYTFKGWTGSNGNTAQTSVTIPKGSTGDKHFVANWTPIDYTITYDLKGGSLPSGKTNPTKYNIETPTFTLNNPTKTGYIFNGWTGSNGNTAQTSVTISQGSTGNKNYTANWTPITYQVRYNKNGGSGSMSNSTYTYDVQGKLTSNAFTRTGYTFAGWATSASGSVVHANQANVLNWSSTNGAVFDLYAKWTPHTYTVTYNGNGNTGGSTAKSTHTYDVAKNLTANGFTKTGYKFAGWTTNSNGTGTAYTNSQSVINLTSTNNGNVNLYAKWTPITYTVKYNGNGNTGGSTANSTHTYDVAKNLTSNGFTKTGYTFAGWATSANGNVAYANQASVKNLTSTDGATVNLYAKWTPITYKIVYHSNFAPGVAEQTKTETHTYDSAKNLLGNTTFSYGNNLLIGWKKTSYNNGTANDIPIPGSRADMYTTGSYGYRAGQSVNNLTSTNNDTIHLYAVWTPKTVEVWGYAESDGQPYGLGDQNYAPNEIRQPQASPAGYLWQEHPSSALDGLKGYNNIRKDDIHAYPVGYHNIYRYMTKGVIMDITYMNYFRFDIRMVNGTLDQLKQVLNGQIEFSSSGTCDNQEISAEWAKVWANSYYLNHHNQDTGDWISIYVPLSIFGGSTNKAAINFVGVYWANAGVNSGLTAYMCDPRFEYDKPAGAVKFDLDKPSEPDPVDFSFDISIDELGAFASDDPVAGTDFEMTFTPAEGYEMPENVLVKIDGVEHVYPSVDLPKGTDVDGNECYVLTVSGELLTPGCSLYIEALVDTVEEPLADIPVAFGRPAVLDSAEPEEETEPTEPVEVIEPAEVTEPTEPEETEETEDVAPATEATLPPEQEGESVVPEEEVEAE